jgi:hypothetical protein
MHRALLVCRHHKMVQCGKYLPLLQIGFLLLAGDCSGVRKTATTGIFASYFLGAAYYFT